VIQDGIDRRRLLFGMAACSLCGASLGIGSAQAKPRRKPLEAVDPAKTERHDILMLLTAKLVYEGWTLPLGNRDLVAAFASIEPDRAFRPYAGHNIGALAVDEHGKPVAFAMNRNVALNSPLEHAEARVLRKVVALNNGDAGERLPFPAIFRNHKIYTSLESCSMCSGMMDLCNIAEVYYAQEDPSQKHIGDILFKLHEADGDRGAPHPFMTSYCSLTPDLGAAYKAWQKRTHEPGTGTDVIAFLASPEAYQAFRKAGRAFDAYRPAHAGNIPFLAEARQAARSLAADID
jgi:tRNA(Arg) A34 adenosine deaminase TadA